MLGPYIDLGGYMSDMHVSIDLFLLTLLNLHQVFMIKPVSPLPYKLDTLYFVHTLIMMGTCQPGK